MKKIIAMMLSVALVAMGLCVSVNAQQQQQVLPPGCTTTSGFSPTTGQKCDAVQMVTVEAIATVQDTTVETQKVPAGHKKVKFTYKDDNCDVQTGTKTVPWGSKKVVTGSRTEDRDVKVRLSVPVINGRDGTNGTNGTNGTDGTNGTNGINGLGCTIKQLPNRKGKMRDAVVCENGTAALIPKGGLSTGAKVAIGTGIGLGATAVGLCVFAHRCGKTPKLIPLGPGRITY